MEVQVTNEQPRFEHYCDQCNFLGRFDHAAGNAECTDFIRADLYFCINGGDPHNHTLLARHSDEGHDYSSSLAHLVRRDAASVALSTHGPGLVEALRRYDLMGGW